MNKYYDIKQSQCLNTVNVNIFWIYSRMNVREI